MTKYRKLKSSTNRLLGPNQDVFETQEFGFEIVHDKYMVFQQQNSLWY